MKFTQWNIAPFRPEHRAALERAGLPALLSAVLAGRGVEDPDQARALLEGGGEGLHDPMEMKDMDRAADRVRRALAAGETVAVYGDYDVDGITSTCLLTDFLRRCGGQVIPYIPDRMGEGYGLNREAAALLKAQGVSLIVTVDCGITAVEEVDFAAELGVDVVITDHHECKDRLPRAWAVVDPWRPDCGYPFRGLAGVGVALKLAMAISSNPRAVLEEYADLAAVGTIADVMPMTDENRPLVRLGLEALARPRRVGLAALLREAGLEGKTLSSVSVGYTLAPRINASGRMGMAHLAVELLLTQDSLRAGELAQQLCQLNRERQSIEGEIFQQCVDWLEREPQPGAVVLSDPGWHQGVVGIVASRLAEKYACPAFMVCMGEDGVGKGSCRSWGNINLFRMLSGCADLLEGFGGHALAAGFTVRAERLPELSRRLREAAREAARNQTGGALEIDAAVQPQDLTVEAIQALERMEPWGGGNPRPVLMLSGAVVQSMTQVGRGRHLKLRLEARGTLLDAIFFSADGGELGLTPGCRVDAAFYPQINEFRGVRTPQLQLLDLRPAMTRAQTERAVYEKYCRGGGLTAEEARSLLPTRAEFVSLWRCLQSRRAGQEAVEDTASHLARASARAGGQRETLSHTLLCLEVFAERGLIGLRRRQDTLSITFPPLEGKVDLEESRILRRLREIAEG
ncbi:MAG: single-stranded-DNA-specific exonuclease RecJ [Lawsonibacter sp.]|nr:single-stranded-DNA-specific exonuclease RecJ [Lawsonibacter sp.]